MRYRAKQALYSTTDPAGPDAARGVITAVPPASGFQLCGEGGVLEEALVRKLCLTKSALVEPNDEATAARESEARNRATYGTAEFRVAANPPAASAVIASANITPDQGTKKRNRSRKTADA